jgi:hypothetical protein
MLPAPNLQEVLERSGFMAPRPDSLPELRLVSIIFAHPHRTVFQDLKANRAYYDQRSGDAWDLYFAGYYMYGRRTYDSEGFSVMRYSNPHDDWWFGPSSFNNLRRDLQNLHGRAVDSAPRRKKVVPWRYSGTPELVNFLVHRGVPDWLSLVSVRLTEGVEREPDSYLPAIVEAHSDWQEYRLPPGYETGERPRSAAQVRRVQERERRALRSITERLSFLIWSPSAEEARRNPRAVVNRPTGVRDRGVALPKPERSGYGRVAGPVYEIRSMENGDGRRGQVRRAPLNCASGGIFADGVGLRSNEDSRRFEDVLLEPAGGLSEGDSSGTFLGDEGVVLVGDADAWGDGLAEVVAGVVEEPAGADAGGAVGEVVDGCALFAEFGGLVGVDGGAEEDAADGA